jgi:hypothetical protein
MKYGWFLLTDCREGNLSQGKQARSTIKGKSYGNDAQKSPLTDPSSMLPSCKTFSGSLWIQETLGLRSEVYNVSPHVVPSKLSKLVISR